MARPNEQDLKKIVARPGYGILGGIKSGFKRQAILTKGDSEGEVSKLEPSPRSKSVRPPELTLPNSRRCFIRIKVFRRRLTDTGNDCWKYHIDALRYLGLLADDNDATVSITEEPHEKVETNEEERVEIDLTYDGFDIQDVVQYYENGPKNQISRH